MIWFDWINGLGWLDYRTKAQSKIIHSEYINLEGWKKNDFQMGNQLSIIYISGAFIIKIIDDDGDGDKLSHHQSGR